MASRTKVLIVDSDIDSLSRIYLALVHRNFKTEASDKAEEIKDRMKRLKPGLIIMGKNEYQNFNEPIKIPCIVLIGPNENMPGTDSEEIVFLKKPIHVESLLRTVESLIY